MIKDILKVLNFVIGFLFNIFIIVGGICKFFDLELFSIFYQNIFDTYGIYIFYTCIYFVVSYILLFCFYFLNLGPGAGNPRNRTIALVQLTYYFIAIVLSIISLIFVSIILNKLKLIFIGIIGIITIIIGICVMLAVFQIIIDTIHKF